MESSRRGLYKLVGKLFSTNAASIELAHRRGFRDVGTHLRPEKRNAFSPDPGPK